MLRWMSWQLLVWSVRVGVLLGACASMQRILNVELGYRMDLQVMLLAGVLMIVTVRIWMPWLPPKREDP